MAELRGEKIIPAHQLNRIVVDVAEVLAKHGYPLKYNEDYNALRSALAQEYFSEWQGYDASEAGYQHTKWADLRDKYQNPSLLLKTTDWIRVKLTRSNSSI